jgi:IPT/TIG domain
MRDFTTLSATAAAITAFATTAQDSKVLMVGCADGTIFRTTNADQGAASTWTQINVTNPPVDQATGNAQAVSAIAIDPTDAKVAAVTYGGINSNVTDQALTKHVFFSADVTTTALTDIGGTSGGNIDESVPNLPVHTVVFDHSTSPHSIIIGCDFSVLRTTDGGSTWHIYGTGIPGTDCTSLAADYSQSPPLIRLGTYGRGAYELTRLTGPRIFVSPNLAFGNVAQGSNSNLTFDIFNIGDAALTITNIADPTAPASPVFSLVAPPAFPFDVAPGGHATVTVGFAPTAPGKQLAMFSVQSNDATHPVFGIPMSGFAAFAGPQVTGIIPSQGPAAGGTAVKIHGSGFTGATAVRFGTLAATGMTVDSDTQISAVTPAGGGQVDVVVVTPSGATAVNPASHFSYLGAAVSITGLNPSQGSETGGTSIVITGIGFSGATQVLFGGFAASGFTLNSDTQITAVSPAGTGVVDVMVATIAGTSAVSPADQFRYVAPGAGLPLGGGTVGAGGTPASASTGDEDILHALADILRTGTDPEILEAQRILVRRIALEGNVIDSRIPPPKNITEVGGYVNLLATLGQTDTRNQALASALGVAGAASSIGLTADGARLAFVGMPNDRPSGVAQPTFTTSISIRSDMADALALALQRIHGLGCALPLYTPPRMLPMPAPGQMLQPDLLLVLGRVLQVAPAALLADPARDPLAIARLSSDPPDRWQLVAQEIDGKSLISLASWVAYQATDADVSTAPVAPRRYIPIAPILADAGWYSTQPFHAPNSAVSQGSLPRLINITGLIRGHTRLGDELLLLYPSASIMASALAGTLSWIWDGTTFVPSESPSATMM